MSGNTVQERDHVRTMRFVPSAFIVSDSPDEALLDERSLFRPNETSGLPPDCFPRLRPRTMSLLDDFLVLRVR